MAKAMDNQKLIQQQACEWSVKLSSEHIDEDTLAEFEAWHTASPAHTEAFKRVEQVWHSFTQLNQLTGETQLARNAPNSKYSQLWEQLTHWLCPRPIYYGLGLACVLSIAVIFLWPRSNHNTINTPAMAAVYKTERQKTQTITLEDGSQLTLGPGTQLNVSINARQRKVTLNYGEVLLSVAHDKNRPFHVLTNNTQTTVLGTVFNVKRFGQSVQITVKEGRVSVGRQSAKAQDTGEHSTPQTGQVLTPGQGVITDLQGTTTKTFNLNPSDVGSWQQQRFTYHNAALEELIADLNRYSKKRIILGAPQLGALRVSLSVEVMQLESTLEDLSQLLELDINRDRAESIVLLPR